jgi:hypothetical protein
LCKPICLEMVVKSGVRKHAAHRYTFRPY